MPWSIDSRRDRHPEVQLGWEIVGAMVKRRRTVLGWTQRELSRRCGLAQSAICRLENGRLRGLRFRRFVGIVVAMGGLDPQLPAPPSRPGIVDLFSMSDAPERDREIKVWLPHLDLPGATWRPRRTGRHQRPDPQDVDLGPGSPPSRPRWTSPPGR